MDFLAGLNPQQREAVAHVEGPLLLLAGAGSGKTRVITHRIAHLIEAHHIPGPAVLAVTFTNKAADEMRQRVGSCSAIPPRAKRRTCPRSTRFACACSGAMAVRSHEIRENFTRQFTIYDDDDQLALLKSIYQASGAGRQVHAVSRGAFPHQPRQKPSRNPARLVQGTRPIPS